MKRKLLHKNPEKHDERECFGNSFSSQNSPPFPSAVTMTPADGKAVNSQPEENNYVHDSKKSMALSVTRHASTPSVDEYAMILKQYGFKVRESANPTNSLPNTLPEKAEQDHDVLRVVECLHMWVSLPSILLESGESIMNNCKY
jgi:hypothetical protein